MTPNDLSLLASMTFHNSSYNWKVALAEHLNVEQRAVKRWCEGVNSIPLGVQQEIFKAFVRAFKTPAIEWKESCLIEYLGLSKETVKQLLSTPAE